MFQSSFIPSRTTVILGFKRLYTTQEANPQTSKALSKILVFPVTKNKSFLYFKYNDTLVNSSSLLVKYEVKAVKLVSKGWKSLSESKKGYNIKIVNFVTNFLKRIPWTEDSLRSIPSSSTLLRQIRTHESTENKVISALDVEGVNKHDIIKIPIYYPPNIISRNILKTELLNISSNGIAYHRKQMLFTGLAVPLSLPVALVPVVPNIPGFYFAYRTYCNLKAYLGAEHLQQLIDKDHLLYEESTKMDEVYASANDDFLFLNETLIDKIVEAYDVEEARTALTKALRQEREKLKKDVQNL